MKYLDGDSAIQQHFETMQNRLDKEIKTLKGQIEESEMARATFDELLEFTRKMPSNLDEIWTGAPLHLRQKVQNLLFCGGLKSDPEIGFLNLDNAHTFNQLQHFLAGNVELVEAGRIELPSETTDNREYSCFFTFYFVSSSTLRTDEDAATTSLIDLIIAVQTEQL